MAPDAKGRGNSAEDQPDNDRNAGRDDKPKGRDGRDKRDDSPDRGDNKSHDGHDDEPDTPAHGRRWKPGRPLRPAPDLLSHPEFLTLLNKVNANGWEMDGPTLAGSISMDPFGPNDMAKAIVTGALGHIPVVGGIISGLVGLFWPRRQPTPEEPEPEPERDVWEEVREEVEALIDQRMDEALFNGLQRRLNALGRSSQLYLNYLHNGAPATTVATQWLIAHNLYDLYKDDFMDANNEWLVAPLFSHFAMLHASLLRDGILHGRSWGWNEGEYQTNAEFARAAFLEYPRHFEQVVRNQEAVLRPGAPTLNGDRTNVHNYWQAFRQVSIVQFDDFRLLVDALNPFTNPGLVTGIPFKDVISLAYGSIANWDFEAQRLAPDGAPWAAYSHPKRQFSSIVVRDNDGRTNHCVITHRAGEGPRDTPSTTGQPVDQYSIVRDAINFPYTRETQIQIPDPGPEKMFNIRSAWIRLSSRASGSPSNLSIWTDDGPIPDVLPTEFELWRTNVGGTNLMSVVSVPNRRLSSLNMWTLASRWELENHVACVIFGFSRDPVYLPDEVLHHLFVTEAFELPEAMVRKIKPEDLRVLKAERVRYWNYVAKESRKHELAPTRAA